MNVFIDTSALTKLYHREQGTDALFEFVSRRKSEHLVIVSDITRIEFRSVFYRKMRMQEISPERVAGVVELFEGDMEFRFRVVEVQSDVKKLAVDVFDSLGPKSSLRTLDALQLATALFALSLFFNPNYSPLSPPPDPSRLPNKTARASSAAFQSHSSSPHHTTYHSTSRTGLTHCCGCSPTDYDSHNMGFESDSSRIFLILALSCEALSW